MRFNAKTLGMASASIVAIIIVAVFFSGSSRSYVITKRFKKGMIASRENHANVQCRSEIVGGQKMPGITRTVFYNSDRKEWCWSNYDDSCRKSLDELGAYICNK